MITYVLYPNTIKALRKSVQYTVIDKNNYLDKIDIIKKSIVTFNSQIK
jgi:hypothetical protein